MPAYMSGSLSVAVLKASSGSYGPTPPTRIPLRLHEAGAIRLQQSASTPVLQLASSDRSDWRTQSTGNGRDLASPHAVLHSCGLSTASSQASFHGTVAASSARPSKARFHSEAGRSSKGNQRLSASARPSPSVPSSARPSTTASGMFAACVASPAAMVAHAESGTPVPASMPAQDNLQEGTKLQASQSSAATRPTAATRPSSAHQLSASCVLSPAASPSHRRPSSAGPERKCPSVNPRPSRRAAPPQSDTIRRLAVIPAGGVPVLPTAHLPPTAHLLRTAHLISTAYLPPTTTAHLPPTSHLPPTAHHTYASDLRLWCTPWVKRWGILTVHLHSYNLLQRTNLCSPSTITPQQPHRRRAPNSAPNSAPSSCTIPAPQLHDVTCVQ